MAAPHIHTIKTTIPISEVAQRLGLKPDGTGRNGQWMFHGPDGNGDTPSLSVSDDKGVFNDFANETAGDHINLVTYVRGDDFGTAVDWLCAEFNIPKPEPETKPARRQQSKEEWLAAECLKHAGDPRLTEYLCEQRKLSEAAVRHAIAKGALGFTDYTSPKCQPGEKFYGGPAVAFIVRDRRGRHPVTAIEKRFPDPALNGGLKVLDTGDITGRFWTADYDRLKAARTVVMVESPINALSVDTVALNGWAALATLGKSNVKKTDWTFLRGKHVILAFDKDAPKHNQALPGQEANWELYDRLSDLGIACVIINQIPWKRKHEPKDTDIDAWLDKNRAEAERIKAIEDPVQHGAARAKIRARLQEYDLDLNDLLQEHGRDSLRLALKNHEDNLIQGVPNKPLRAYKNRVWLPKADQENYWRFRTHPDHTYYLKTVMDIVRDDSGEIVKDEFGQPVKDEVEVPVDICGFRIANLRKVQISGYTAAATGCNDDTPLIHYVAHVQTRLDGPRLRQSVFKDGLYDTKDWEKRFGGIYDAKSFKRALTILENTAVRNPIHASNIVGLAWLDGKLRPNEGSDCYFAKPEQQCAAYNALTFHSGLPADGRTVLEAYQTAFTNNAALLMLIWSLGTHLKLFTGFYPHLLTGGDKGVGKSRLLESLGITTPLVKTTAEESNEYRLRINTSGTSFPVAVDEISNAPMKKRIAVSSALQNLYTRSELTATSEALPYLKFAPVLVGGEELADMDNALSKTVRVMLTIAARGTEVNPHAIPRWPVRQWLEYLAAVPRPAFDKIFGEAQQICTEKAVAADATSQRMVKNYALLLTAWRYTADFTGVARGAWRVEEAIIREMNLHIRSTDSEREPWVKILEQIIFDLGSQKYPYPWDVLYIWADKEKTEQKRCLLIKPAEIMNHIQRSPELREFREKMPISSKNALRAQLKSKGMLYKEAVHPYINQQRVLNCVAIPLAKLLEYGLIVPGDYYDDDPELAGAFKPEDMIGEADD